MNYAYIRYRHFFSIFCCLFLFVGHAFGQGAGYTVKTLPNPKQAGQDFYVSNPDGILSTAAVERLNSLAKEVDEAVGAEYAIVVVDDFKGADVFDFALHLFNTWGIGKKGQDNGLLLFIAKDRHAYRFISGYGMEGIFPDAYLHRIGTKYLVPNFREGDYDEGIWQASTAIRQALLAPDTRAELQRMMPEAAPFFSRDNVYLKNSLLVILLYAGMYYWVFHSGNKWAKGNGTFASSRNARNGRKKGKKGCRGWFIYSCLGGLATIFTLLFAMMIFAFVLNDMERLFHLATLPYLFAIWGSYVSLFKIIEQRDRIKKSYRDEQNRLEALRGFQRAVMIPLVLSPLVLFSMLKFRDQWKRSRARFLPPDDSGDWERVNRDAVKLKEIKAYLGEGRVKEESLRSRFYEIWTHKKTGKQKIVAWKGTKAFSVCPSCNFRTYEKGLRGKTLKQATYKHSGLQEVYDLCRHCQHKEDKGTRVIPKKVRSSSGSSGSGGSRGSSSSGGSFGGGSSGGGGAGGNW